MKNVIKAVMLMCLVGSLASCYGGSPDGKTDSVANHDNHEAGGATTVDTLPKTIDTAKADSAR
ncbi:hypothetical protein [uncultured Mucilaginibacter sp.]|uniref:hypothetical protein n=1 Tax=uncultured Mucilaginibacter sp. TaxID=797541 RepID=UPI0025E3CC4C|nr:hypothetical protein [uncultured Mucilaginibacter sp.]